MAKQILTHNDNDHTGRRHIFLGTGIDKTELGDIIDLAQNIGGHISHQRDISGFRKLGPAGAVDGIVCGDMDIAGVRTEGIGRKMGVVVLAGGTGDVDLTIFFGFHQCVVGKIAAVNIVSLSATHEVHGNRCEHGRGAALKEENLISLGNPHHIFQIFYRLLENVQIHFGAMAHFHDGHAGIAIAEKIALNLFKYRKRQHGGAGCKVINTFHYSHLDRLIVRPGRKD